MKGQTSQSLLLLGTVLKNHLSPSFSKVGSARKQGRQGCQAEMEALHGEGVGRPHGFLKGNSSVHSAVAVVWHACVCVKAVYTEPVCGDHRFSRAESSALGLCKCLNCTLV